MASGSTSFVTTLPAPVAAPRSEPNSGGAIEGGRAPIPSAGLGAPLVGASRNTYNVVGYYENYGFSARIAYTYRSHFFVGLDRSTAEFQDDTGVLAASLQYKINDNLTLTFDALNLNNPTLKYYAENTDQPRAFYKNGRQYYAGVLIKF